MTGKEYEMIFQENGLIPSETGNKKLAQKAASKRHSSREKKPVNIKDLGYVDKDQSKKGSLTASEGYKKCDKLLTLLKRNPYAGQFMVAPIDIPGYTTVIAEPMDLTTVEKKLKAGQYPSSYHFALDIRKIWNNSWTYNQPGSEIYKRTSEISGEFEKLMKDVGDAQFVTEENQEIQDLQKMIQKVNGALKRYDNNGVVSGSSKTGIQKNLLEEPMNAQEKTQLKQRIMGLSQDKLAGMIQIIQDTIDMSKNNKTLEFDIDSLPTRKCRELEQYVAKATAPAKTSKKKPPPKVAKAPPKPLEVSQNLPVDYSFGCF